MSITKRTCTKKYKIIFVFCKSFCQRNTISQNSYEDYNAYCSWFVTHHVHMCTVTGFCGATEDASPMMILEFMQFGDLHSFMVHNRPNSKSSGLPLSTLYSIAMDVSTVIGPTWGS